MAATTATVIVVGGGIGGATLALALARRGIDVAVIEQAAAFKPIYKGEYLQPASLETFAALGLTDAIRAVTYPVYVTRIGTDTGETLMQMEMRELGEFEGRNGHHRQIQGAVLHALAALPNATIQMGVRLTGLRRERDGWSLTTSAGEMRARVIVGADGRRSAVRKLLGIAAAERPYPGAALAVTVDLPAEAEHTFHQLFGGQDSAYYFPLPDRQARLYLGLRTDSEYDHLRAQPDGGLAHLKERLGLYFPVLRPEIAGIDFLHAVQVIPSYYLMDERWVTD
ncbi:MAG: hypothetical protein JWN15_3854, partial [Firmicutes bacterium]|nr:hypothetical protein [Bacillota bacterium]